MDGAKNKPNAMRETVGPCPAPSCQHRGGPTAGDGGLTGPGRSPLGRRLPGAEWVDPRARIVFCWAPPGEFWMGSAEEDIRASGCELPRHQVRFDRGFWLGKYPVTQQEWQLVMGSNPSRRRGLLAPVDSVSWQDVQLFLAALNQLAGTDRFRLPSEAEWEYACRAGTLTVPQSGFFRMFRAGAPLRGGPRLVGGRAPNAWGLHDMLGNISEWVADTWHDDYHGAPEDGRPWTIHGTSFRVRRGGPWSNLVASARAALREADDPRLRFDNVGFRIACDEI